MPAPTITSYFTIDAGQKTLCHAATCILSNYLTVLVEEGLQYFETIGIRREEGLKAVLPLLRCTTDNIALLGTERALTGSIARGDVDTIRSHVRSIGQDLPGKLVFYRLMAERTLGLAKREKLKDAVKAQALASLLDTMKRKAANFFPCILDIEGFFVNCTKCQALFPVFGKLITACLKEKITGGIPGTDGAGSAG